MMQTVKKTRAKLTIEHDSISMGQISIESNGVRLGSIWGVVRPDESEFGQKHNIVHIYNKATIIAIIWDAEIVDNHINKLGGIENAKVS